MTAPLRFERFELNMAERTLTVEGRPVALGARAFDLLTALVERRDRVVTKGELLDVAWPGLVVEENNLQVQVSVLRKVLGASAIATIAGRGYRLTASPLVAPAAAPQALGSAPVRTNLPPSLTRFIGRDSALVDGERLLKRSRLLTLTGIGGCGKTRLALEMARRQLDGFADGVWFIDLAPVQDPTRVASVVAAVLGIRESQTMPMREHLQAHVAARQMLFIIDNCEHLLDAVADIVDALLGAGAGIRIVATSREAFGVAGEQIYPVRSLSLPTGLGVAAVRDSESAQVFVDRAGLFVPDFALDDTNAPLVAEICRRLDGIALAIELAAARVALLSVEEIRDRLDDRFRLLSGGTRALPRHQTLQAVMLWSYTTLSAAEQALFRRLSVFVGGWTLAAAASVAGSGDEHQTLELLTALHQKSLLTIDRDGKAPPRYGMLETVRQYAQDRLDESSESDDVRRRHLEHFVTSMEAAAALYGGARQGDMNALMRREQENVLAAHDWSAHVPDDGALGLRLTSASWRYMVSSDQLELGRRLAETSLQRAVPGIDIPARARLLVGLATTLYYLGRYDEALRRVESGLAMAREIGDLVLVTNALVMQGAAQPAGADIRLRDERDAEIERLARSLNDDVLLARSLNHLGEQQRARGNHAAAARHYEDALVAGRRTGHPGTTAVLACNFGRLCVAVGAADKARALLREALKLALDNELRGMAQHLFEVGAGLAVLVGDIHVAARLNGTALRRMRDSGARREPVDEEFIAPLLRRARESLGDAAYDSAEAAGQALGIDGGLRELETWLRHDR